MNPISELIRRSCLLVRIRHLNETRFFEDLKVPTSQKGDSSSQWYTPTLDYLSQLNKFLPSEMWRITGVKSFWDICNHQITLYQLPTNKDTTIKFSNVQWPWSIKLVSQTRIVVHKHSVAVENPLIEQRLPLSHNSHRWNMHIITSLLG